MPEKGILQEIGKKKNQWLGLTEYLKMNYDHIPQMKKEGKDDTWVIRYRKGGKTLVTLYPKKEEFIVLIVLGMDEVKKVRDLKLSRNVKNVFENAKQFHDGRWLWIRPRGKDDIESVKSLLTAKKKPRL